MQSSFQRIRQISFDCKVAEVTGRSVECRQFALRMYWISNEKTFLELKSDLSNSFFQPFHRKFHRVFESSSTIGSAFRYGFQINRLCVRFSEMYYM